MRRCGGLAAHFSRQGPLAATASAGPYENRGLPGPQRCAPPPASASARRGGDAPAWRRDGAGAALSRAGRLG